MRRRAAFVFLPLSALALVAAAAPWTLSSDGVRSVIAGQLKSLYGLDLSVKGRTVIAFLPMPRVKFEDMTLSTADAKPLARGGLLRAELRVLPLLLARLEFAEILLKDAAIDVDIDERGSSAWDTAVAHLRSRLEAGVTRAHVGQIVLTGADVIINDRRSGYETTLRDINLVANWPSPGARLNLAGSLTWRGEPVEITAASFAPSAVAAGRPARVNLQLSAPLARVAINGDLSWPESPRLIGRTSFETRSLRDFSRWSGLGLPLAHLVQAFALDSDMNVDGDTVSWPSARLNLAGDRLEGALSLRLEGERRVITGTLAADQLDLTGFAVPLAQARTPGGGWSSDGIDLQGRSATDLDLRISASRARLATLRMEDLAANLSIKPGRYEASVGRVSISKGTAKGRVILASAADGIEVKAQSSFDRIDLASLLTDVSSSRWLTGLAQGQVTLEGSGDNAAEIVGRLQGRASLTVRQGELVGLGFTDPARRNDKAAVLMPSGRGSRMPFDEAHLNVTMTDGTAEIREGGLTAAGLQAGLQGYVSVPDHMVSVRANIEGTRSTLPLGVDIKGPWNNVAIMPHVGLKGGDRDSTGSTAVVQ